MGFMNFIKGQLLNNIEFRTDDKSLLAHCYDRKGKQIMMNANLTVYPGQIAVFVNEGQIADVFNEGRHKLTTKNMPIMTKLNSWKYGFKSPFIVDIYFIMVDSKLNQKWGTANKVGIKHNDLGKIYIGANGQYSYKISDPEVFMRKIVSSSNDIYVDDCKEHFNTEINAMFKDTLSESKINFDDAFDNLEEFGQTIKEHGNVTFKALGLKLLSFTVSDLVMSESLHKVMEDRSTVKAFDGLNMNGYSRKKTVDSASDAMVNMSEREGGMGMGMGNLGMEMGAGMMMGQMMNKIMKDSMDDSFFEDRKQFRESIKNNSFFDDTQHFSQTIRMVECPKCHQSVREGEKFCSYCGNKMKYLNEMTQCINCHVNIPIGSKFCPTCGANQEKNRCIKCNAELTEDAKFCMKCGAKQDSELKN